jgi:hypothetical protein
MSGRELTRRLGWAAVIAAGVLGQASCSDDDTGPAGGAGGEDDEQAEQAGASGLSAGGGEGGQARASAGSPAGGSETERGGQPGAGQAGEPGVGAAGATPEGGGAGGATSEEPCEGEVVAGECLPLFSLAQSNSFATGSAASSAAVTLPNAVTAGNTLLLGVGVIWNGVAKTITVPAAFSVVERRDNDVGAMSHESVVLYLAANAAAPAQSQVTVGVDDPSARIYLAIVEYAGLSASELVDQKVSQSGTSDASPGVTPETSDPNELWVVVTQSRGGIEHKNPTNGFEHVEAKMTGAGSFSFMQKLVSQRAAATTSLTSSGDYASLLVTLRR